MMDLDEDTRTTDEIVAAVIEKLPAQTYLHYIDRGDQLQPEQVKEILEEPEDGLHSVELAIWEHFSEYDYIAVKHYYEDVTTAEERERLEVEDRELEIHDLIRERDASTIFEDLLRATPNMLFRYDLGMDVGHVESMDDDEFSGEATRIAIHLGIDPDLNNKALRQMLTEASYGGRLYIAWYTDIETVLDMDGKIVTFSDPHLLILNRMNGSGMDCKVDGDVRIKYERKNVALDHGPYSWSDVCGAYEPAYACEVKVESH